MKLLSKTVMAAFFLVSPAIAGDYHRGATLRCAQCHVMHFSQSHGYNANGTGFYTALASGGPFHYLLRAEVNDLCLSCHDENGIAPDVLGPNNGNEPADVRLAGYLNRLGVEGLDPTGHTLDSLATAPGSNPPWKAEDENGAGEGLSCTNCHHQHGRGTTTVNCYRNLKTDAGNWGSNAAPISYNDTTIGTNDLTKDVFERSAAAYDEGDMDWDEPVNTASAIGKWCSGCHTNFHGAPGDPNTVGGTAVTGGYDEFLRHPTAGVNIGAIGSGHSTLATYNSHTNKVKVMSEVGVWSPAGADVTPTCVSCHKAHGNGNAFGLIYRSGTGTKTENGDTNGTVVENLCAQCHTQASSFSNP